MADLTPNRPPLWKVMQDAYYSVQQHPDVLSEDCERQTIAAELRAIAEEIARRDPDNTMSALAVEEWLCAEADRAEAGQ